MAGAMSPPLSLTPPPLSTLQRAAERPASAGARGVRRVSPAAGAAARRLLRGGEEPASEGMLVQLAPEAEQGGGAVTTGPIGVDFTWTSEVLPPMEASSASDCEPTFPLGNLTSRPATLGPSPSPLESLHPPPAILAFRPESLAPEISSVDGLLVSPLSFQFKRRTSLFERGHRRGVTIWSALFGEQKHVLTLSYLTD